MARSYLNLIKYTNVWFSRAQKAHINMNTGKIRPNTLQSSVANQAMQPRRYLRLENSKDGAAWRAAVRGVSESGTTDYGLFSTGLEEPFSAFSPPQLCSLFSGRVCGVPGAWALSPVTGVGSGIGSQWERLLCSVHLVHVMAPHTLTRELLELLLTTSPIPASLPSAS